MRVHLSFILYTEVSTAQSPVHRALSEIGHWKLVAVSHDTYSLVLSVKVAGFEPAVSCIRGKWINQAFPHPDIKRSGRGMHCDHYVELPEPNTFAAGQSLCQPNCQILGPEKVLSRGDWIRTSETSRSQSERSDQTELHPEITNDAVQYYRDQKGDRYDHPKVSEELFFIFFAETIEVPLLILAFLAHSNENTPLRLLP
jgi:hypothetical protein